MGFKIYAKSNAKKNGTIISHKLMISQSNTAQTAMIIKIFVILAAGLGKGITSCGGYVTIMVYVGAAIAVRGQTQFAPTCTIVTALCRARMNARRERLEIAPIRSRAEIAGQARNDGRERGVEDAGSYIRFKFANCILAHYVNAGRGGRVPYIRFEFVDCTLTHSAGHRIAQIANHLPGLARHPRASPRRIAPHLAHAATICFAHHPRAQGTQHCTGNKPTITITSHPASPP